MNMESIQFDFQTKTLNFIKKKIPELTESNQVLVKVRYAGICGTDLHIIEGHFPCNEKIPFSLGHEFSGEIVEVGKEVVHLKKADRVVVDPNSGCNVCYFCHVGSPHYCKYGGVNNTIGIVRDGGWAQYCVLPSNQVHKLPDNISFEQAALCEPLSCLAHGLDRINPIFVGQKILIIGAGIIGNLWAILLHLQGHRNVTISEPNKVRLNQIKKLNTGYNLITPDELKQFQANDSNYLYDVIIDCSGFAPAIEHAFTLLNCGGKLCVFGVASPEAKISISPFEIFKREAMIIGVNINPFTFPKALGLIDAFGERYLNYENLGIKTYQLSEHKKAIEDLKKGEIAKAIFKIIFYTLNMCIQVKLVLLILSILIIQLNSQDICKQCRCTGETSKSIDCSGRNVTFKFNDINLWTSADNKTIDVVSLNLQNNYLTHVYPFPNLNVITLDLSKNRIAKIEPLAFKNLQKMETLDLSENQLRSETLTSEVFQGKYIPEDYEPLQSLKTLRLSENILHTLHSNVFEHTTHIEALYLDSNPLSTIDHPTIYALSDLPYLKVLDLSKTNIQTLPNHMLHTPKYLQVLNISRNQFERLPETLSDAHSLEVLSISDNSIVTLGLDNSFPHIKTLKELHITDMRYLTRVEKGTFSALANLKELYLTDNKNLEWIDEDAFSLEDKYQNSTKTWIPLKTLHLQRNNLSSLSENMFNDWKSLETIDIQFNPWSCDCDNQWLISKLIPVIQNETNHSTKHLQCYYPKDLRGFNMSEMAMHNKVLRCTDKYGNLWPENDGSILLGILIGILTTVPIMFLILFFCQRKNYFGLIGTRGPGDYARTFYKPADSDDF